VRARSPIYLPSAALSFGGRAFAGQLFFLLSGVENLVVAHALRLDLWTPSAAFYASTPAIGLRRNLVNTLNVELVVSRHLSHPFVSEALREIKHPTGGS
jgi:hypothetical protein